MNATADFQALRELMPSTVPSDTTADWEALARSWGNATGGMRHEVANAVKAWDSTAKSLELADASPELIAWGADFGVPGNVEDATRPRLRRRKAESARC